MQRTLYRDNGIGVVLANYLNFNLHIEKITSKIARSPGILWKVRKFLSAETLLNLYYYALIYPHLL